ncbi:MAG TPA: hypothetical protein VIY48_21080, partial [Candidatus Paceibacterota bacterium]
MSQNRELVDNVLQFLERASNDFGRIKSEQFSQDLFCQLTEWKIESPIEDLFFIACHVICAAEYTDLNPDPFINSENKLCVGIGMHIHP